MEAEKNKQIEEQSKTEKQENNKKKGGLITKIILALIVIGVVVACVVLVLNKKREEELKQEHKRQIEQSIPGGQVDNLQWSSRTSKTMNWEAAVSYCENLTEDKHDDWRLPNIDELRSVVKNCPKTETGGECKVSEKGECLSLEQCGNDRLKGSCFCDYKKNNGGYYSKLGDPDGVWLWSSSVVSDKPDSRWRIGFSSAFVIQNDVGINFHVRCVRMPNL